MSEKFEALKLMALGVKHTPGMLVIANKDLNDYDIKGATWQLNDDGTCELKEATDLMLGFGGCNPQAHEGDRYQQV